MPTTSSLPNIREDPSHHRHTSRKIYSVSLSQLDHGDHGDGSSEHYHIKPSPYYIRWVHGFNPDVGVINLCDRGSSELFYAACNFGILYNWTTRQMTILQGHRHMVTTIAKDATGKWLVTGDSGSENIIIIWDHTTCFPQRTIFNPHKEVRLTKLALSDDAKYLTTIGYKNEKAEVFWWIWSFGESEPHAVTEIPITKDSVIDLAFNPNNSSQFVLITKQELWIFICKKIWVNEMGLLKETDKYELKGRCPPRTPNSDHGRMTCFAFISTTSQVLVGTSRGYILVYGYTLEHNLNVDSSNIENFKYVKALKVENHKINAIKWIDGVVAVGNAGGEIRFYDDQMKLLYWVHHFTVDCVRGISFNISPRSFMILDPLCEKKCPCWEQVIAETDSFTGQLRTKLLKTKIPSDCTKGALPLIVRDFIICTAQQGIGFVNFVPEKNQTILEYRWSPALALTVHPEKPLFCVGYLDGVADLVNFTGHHRLQERLDLRDCYKVVVEPKEDAISSHRTVTRPQLSITCLKYSPSGNHLACGLNTGQLVFLDPFTLKIRSPTPFKDTQFAIKEINFSPDSLAMACVDIGKTVLVYKFNRSKDTWQYLGKHRGHYKDISTVFFLPEKNPDGEYKLLSFGKDRIMVEYDIGASTGECLEINSIDRIDQTAVPLGGIVWPVPKDLDPDECHTEMPTVLLCNDEYKYKIVNYETATTLATYLGPRYEHPVKQMKLIRYKDPVTKKTNEYLLFCTKLVIGIEKLPLDGNPWKHVGMLGHPNHILNMCYRCDEALLFTIGAKDCCVLQWAANFRAVEKTTILGGTDLDPYYCLVENGRPGWLFEEIRDLFYYIQILCQGTFSPAVREVKDRIPIGSLPDLMRTLGLFASGYEVGNLIVEAKYKVYNKNPAVEIDFEEFVKLYLNHRPAFPEGLKKLRAAFKTFGQPSSKDDGRYMYREDFVGILSDHGEKWPTGLTQYLVSILSGQSFEDRANAPDEDFTFLPPKIRLNDLVSNILGIPESETPGSSAPRDDLSSSESEGEYDFERLFSH